MDFSLMDAVAKRRELKDRLIHDFSSMPEVWAIYTFGREVAGTVDQYSDIDLIFCSRDLSVTRKKCFYTIEAIAPVIGTCTLVERADLFAEMVMLEGYSPYQKIDFSITRDLETQRQFAPFAALYRNDETVGATGKDLPIEDRRQVPQNDLNDVLFSVPRFTKCLFRGDRDMYRRWVGVVNRALILLHEKHTNWQEERSSGLSPPEYQHLYRLVEGHEGEHLNSIVPVNGEVNLASSFAAAVDLIIALWRQKAEASGWRLDMEFPFHIQRFLHDETERYRKS